MSCIVKCFLFSILAIICIGIPTIIWMKVIKFPENPTFTLEEASVTGFNLTFDHRFTSFFRILIQAKYPNHTHNLEYEDVHVSIFKKKQILADYVLSEFVTQPRINVTLFRAEPIALDVALKKDLAVDFWTESQMGYLDFDVSMTSLVNGEKMEVNCKHAVVNITAAPTASTPSHSCSPT